jgi:hypothetical protein
MVEIVYAGIASSTARIMGRNAAEQIRQGDEATLLAPGADAPPRSVSLLQAEVSTTNAASLEKVERLLKRYGGAYVQPSLPGQPADFRVSINERGEYLILDTELRLFPNLGPAMRVTDDAAAIRLIERLVHLSKYLNLRELENNDSQSTNAHYFSIELVGSPHAGSGNGDAPTLAGAAISHTLKVGDWVYLRARNNGAATLKVTVLDLRPNWSVAQIFPSGAGLFEMLEPGRELFIPLRADLPQGYDEGIDVLKVFATTETADLRCFQLPALDLPPGLPAHTLRTPFAASSDSTLAEHEASTRDMGAGFSSSEDWIVLRLDIGVRRTPEERGAGRFRG